ncbi:MAG: endolytic transglycosylase MltG [Gammaproteobacteria bacterium]|nr:endolytic transglycosylase MltG [Gammaproteobacteria bacterium]
MKRWFKRIFMFIVLLVVGAAVGLWLDIQRFLSTPLQLPREDYTIEVKPGATLRRVAKQLAAQGIVNKPQYLLWYARWYKQNDRIHVGEYRIEPADTPATLLDHMLQGRVIQYAITIIEGWTFEQLLQVINSDPVLQHTLRGLDHQAIMLRLGHPGIYPEGHFLPDTYQFPRGTTDLAFLQRAYQAMEGFITAQWQQRDTAIAPRSIEEALTLASIVEKETGLASERSAISGVFNRRLLKRMKLQSDPTVIYAMGERFKGNLRKRDLSIASPYNTYQVYGLPPTPIALPGKAAIEATLHPDKTDNLYFVSKNDGSGQSYFSATLEQHNNAVMKYQLKGRQRPFSSTPGTVRQ